MGINDYQLSGGINSNVEEVLSKGLNAAPGDLQAVIEELTNRDYTSDLEYLLAKQRIQQCQQWLNLQATSSGIVGYTDDLRDAINLIQSTLSTLQATVDSLSTTAQGKANTDDVNTLQSTLSTLQTTVDSLSTTVQGKANSTDLADALALKADKDDVVDPKWGQITGNLPDQTDLLNALSGKASTSNLAAIDTRTRNLESAIATKANQDDLNAKADKDYVDTAFDLKADTSYVVTMFATKADKDAVTALQSTLSTFQSTLSTLQTTVDSLTTIVQGKASVTLWPDVEIPVNGWSDSAPYTQTVTVTGMLATYNPDVDVKFTDNTTTETENDYYNCVDDIVAGDNSITLVCPKEKPAGTFHIKMREVG